MTNSEKITINLEVADLGKIDLLVDRGFYANRTDFIKHAIRKELGEHQTVIDQQVKILSGTDGTVSSDPKAVKSVAFGVLSYGRKDLERLRAEGKRLSALVIGTLLLEDGVTPELADEVVEKFTVFGVFKASPEVKQALGSRTKVNI
jgi:Arc/MetJ-type ribon-helix-helix transcriptional regulator